VSAKRDYTYHDSRFSLNRKKIVELLMGNRLYRNSLYSLRECIQNALDATEVYSRKDPHLDRCIVVDVSAEGVVDIFDNGTGIDQDALDRHFLSVGESAFWYSDRGISEWQGIRKNEYLIADHGIGALSYFMVADRVEVFSLYCPSQELVHAVLDDYLDGVIYRCTPIRDFPAFDSSSAGVPSPWTLRHGTLVRMHLAERVEPRVVLRFLARHILRPHSRLIFMGQEGAFDLPDVWHNRSDLDGRIFGESGWRREPTSSSPSDSSIAEAVREMYEPKKGFYDNPPADRAIIENWHAFGESRYRVFPRVDENEHGQFRLSQNGVLVEDAEIFFRAFDRSPLFKTFDVDIDVRGKCFQLNAERTQIQGNAHNQLLAEELIRAFEASYFEQLTKIESTVYFPCGKHYYHGMDYVLFEGESLRVAFHRPLHRYFQADERDLEMAEACVKAAAAAKLYCVGADRSHPVSVLDIQENQSIQEILVLRKELVEQKFSISDYSGKRDRGVASAIRTIRRHSADLNSTVYIPGNVHAFVLPLARYLYLSISYESKAVRILKIHRGAEPNVSSNFALLESPVPEWC